jgi:LacI family transcriptional regulator
MRSSLKDIADKLNLSKTTVSWVLTGKGDGKGISKVTQELVQKCAREMNYQPNLIARSLNIGKSRTIGLILPSISDYFYSSVAREIEKNASAHGYSLMIASSEAEKGKEESILRMFRSKGVDGIIIAPTKLSTVEIDRLIRERFPLITFDRYFPNLPVSHIIIDNRESGYKLTRHMIGLGAKKIALITTNPHLTTMQDRCGGYWQALKDMGVRPIMALEGVVDYEGYEHKIIKVLDRIFEKVPDVDGFFFTTHILALEAFLYFTNRGIDYNRDFRMASIHSVETYKILAPGISYAEMPIADIGKNAVEVLIKEIEAKGHDSGERGQYRRMTPCTLYLNSR